MATSLPSGAKISYRRQYRRCGKAGCPTCGPGMPGHGPYWYAAWWADGKMHSRYMGRELPAGALQEPAASPPESRVGPIDDPALPEQDPSPEHNGATATAPDLLRVRTLGGFMVWRGDSAIATQAWTRRKVVGALLKQLLSAEGWRLPREQLMESLWPDAEPAAAAGNLRYTVHVLRRLLDALGGSGSHLRSEGEMLALLPLPGGEPPEDWLDAAAFERAARRALAGRDAAACDSALRLYGGDYLPDDPYSTWAEPRREELSTLRLSLLLHQAALHTAQGDTRRAAASLQEALQADPYHEEAARALMGAQAAAGQHAEAIRTYQRLAAALERELGLAPSPETEAHYRAALAGKQAAASRRTNLPTPLTGLLGREEELAALSDLLARAGPAEGAAADGGEPVRLLTVTGAGGGGKTRLAIELGHRLRDRYPDGVWLIELAALPPDDRADAAPIVEKASEVFGLREGAEGPDLHMLVSHLQARHALLILDNCEHLIGRCAAFAAAVLRGCPGVQILATSREALGVLGETAWRLPSLATPPRRAHGEPSLKELGRYAAIQLFLERARAVRPGIALTRDNRRAIAEICTQLDGIPLAIELAAARVSLLPVEDLAARLDDRFRLLSAGNRAAPPRHQTLRAVIEWSYDLLSPPEQLLLRRLSVFAGGWTIDAAEAMCAGVEGSYVCTVDVLAGLERKSLIHVDDGEGSGRAARYRLLETVRQYAAQKLRAHGEEIRARDEHLTWYVALAEQAEPALQGPEQQRWLERLEAEHDNLRAALAWGARDGGDAEAGLRLAGALRWFWEMRAHWTEGRRWLTALLAEGRGSARARLPALTGLGALASNQNDFAQSRAAHEERLSLARTLGDTEQIAGALNSLGIVLRGQGDYKRAVALFEESLALRRRPGDSRAIAATLNNLGLVAQEQGDLARAVALYEESLALKRPLGDRTQIAYSLFNIAVCTHLLGDHRQAYPRYTALLELFEELSDTWGLGAVRYQLGRLAYDQGDHGAAIEHLRVCLPRFQELGDTGGLVTVLELWAAVAAASGRAATGARLFGAADAARAGLGTPLSPADRTTHAADLAAVRQLLDADSFAAAWSVGQTMTLEQAVAEAQALGG